MNTRFRRVTAVFLLFAVMLQLVSCGNKNQSEPTSNLTIWIQSIFTDSVLQSSTNEEDATVSREEAKDDTSLAREDGDSLTTKEDLEQTIVALFPKATLEISFLSVHEMEEEVKAGKTPNLILAAPDVLETFRNKFTYLDLAPLFTPVEETDTKDEKSDEDIPASISVENPLVKLFETEGRQEFYPVLYSPQMMAFNKQILERAGLLETVTSSETREMTMEQYTSLLTSLHEKLPADVDTAILYYAGVTGDAGIKQLILNAYGAKTMDEIGSEAGMKSLNTFASFIRNNQFGEGKISLAEHIAQSDLLVNGIYVTYEEALASFIEGETSHIFLYNHLYDLGYSGLKKDEFDALFVPYPSPEGSTIDFDVYMLAGVESDEKSEKLTADTLAVLDGIANSASIYTRMMAYSGMVSANPAYNTGLEGELAFLASTLASDLVYHPFENETDEERLAFLYLLKRVLFDGDDPAEVLPKFKDGTLVSASGSENEDD